MNLNELLRKMCIDLCVICEDNEVMKEAIMNYFDNFDVEWNLDFDIK